jgi:hypothetical protein
MCPNLSACQEGVNQTIGNGYIYHLRDRQSVSGVDPSVTLIRRTVKAVGG